MKVEQGGGRVVVAWCEQGRADGPWEMNGQQLRHTKLGRCLALNPDTRELAMQSCREENQYQVASTPLSTTALQHCRLGSGRR